MADDIQQPQHAVDLTRFRYEERQNQEADHIKFSNYLSVIQSKMSSWMKMAKDRRSHGAQFLNIIGLEFDDMKFVLDYAFQQVYIESANLNQAHEAFKGTIPSTISNKHILKIHGDIYQLEEANTMIAFLTGMEKDKLLNREIFYNNPYFIDWERRVIYVRKPYGEGEKFPEGHLTVEVYREDGLSLGEHEIALRYHHVWNFFDEFGYLLDTPRLYREGNEEYKRRILDVFKHPANSSKQGLKNGLARELSLIRQQTWKDPKKPIYLRYPRVDVQSIEINGEPIDTSYIRKTRREGYAIEPIPTLPLNSIITYVTGIELYELHDKEDVAFQNELFETEGTASPILERYVRQIADRLPVNWGQFKWDEGFWDIADADMSGHGYIPNRIDASISGWEKYNKPKGDVK